MQPEVQLLIKGKAYQGWFRVDIDSDIFQPADAFEVAAKLPPVSELDAFRPGESVEVYVGDRNVNNRQLAGVIDERRIGGTRARTTLTVTGRDKGYYLVDNEADAVRVKGLTIKQLAEKLLKPQWGIREVIVSNDQNRKALLGKKDRGSKAGTSSRQRAFGLSSRATTKIDPGQRIAQILDDHTRRVGCTWWLTADGKLVLGRPTYEQEPSFQFLLYAGGKAAQQNNILPGWSAVDSTDDRYSEIEVRGQGASSSGLLGGAASGGSTFKAVATDPDLKARGIVRRLILTDSDARNRRECEVRAKYEMGLRRMRAGALHISVAGWEQSDRLYTIDTTAIVKIERAGIDAVYWIGARQFVGQKSLRRTNLTLYPRGLWLADEAA